MKVGDIVRFCPDIKGVAAFSGRVIRSFFDGQIKCEILWRDDEVGTRSWRQTYRCKDLTEPCFIIESAPEEIDWSDTLELH